MVYGFCVFDSWGYHLLNYFIGLKFGVFGVPLHTGKTLVFSLASMIVLYI